MKDLFGRIADQEEDTTTEISSKTQFLHSILSLQSLFLDFIHIISQFIAHILSLLLNSPPSEYPVTDQPEYLTQ
jgi:type VII secretion effector (TIGR04197 family)